MASHRVLVAISLCCWWALLAASSETDRYRLPRVLADGPRRPIEVAQGRRTNLSRFSHLMVNEAARDGVCKVEVDGSDCLSQTVGQVKPKVFDCFFGDGDVYYEHEGSPFSVRDSVRLQVQYFFGKNNTIVLPLRLEVRVNLSKSASEGRRLVLAGPEPLAVHGSRGRTQPISSNAIRFAYDPQTERCTIEHRREWRTFRHWPLAGRLLNDREQVMQEFRLDCHLFLLSAYKYERIGTKVGLEFDYLPVSVKVLRFGASASETLYENIYLSIRLTPTRDAASLPLPTLRSHTGGLPATLPKNLVLANVTNLVVQLLEFTVVASTGLNVTLVDIREPGSIPLDGFELADLRSGHIALQVLGVTSADRIQFHLRLRPIDTLLRVGPEVTLQLVSRVQHRRLQLFTSPMRVCTGGTALLRPHNLQSASWSETVRFRVKRDPYSGRLTINGAPLRSFNSRRLARFWKFRIAYIHNGNLPRHDSIGLRAVFRGIRVSFQFPIRVVRNWDAASSLKSRIRYRLTPSGTLCIGEEAINESVLKYLLADGVQLQYRVTQQPVAGGLIMSELTTKSTPSGRVGSVEQFTLADLFTRTICYVNHGDSITEMDSLKIRQIGQSDLTELVIQIVIQPKATLENKSIRHRVILSLPETQREGLRINRSILNYETVGLSPSQIGYEVLLQPHFTTIGANLSLDAGRLIDARRLSSSSTKIQEIATLTWFSQEDINNGYVRYVPPLEDVGSSGRPVEMLLQPLDFNRNRALPHKLSFFVRAVDDMKPRLRICSNSSAFGAVASVTRNSHTSLDGHQLIATDSDTGPERLELILVRGPRYGQLVQEGTVLKVGQRFNVGRVRQRSIQYRHNGSTVSQDSFSVQATDGKNFGPNCTISINVSEPLEPMPVQNAPSQHQREQEQPQLEETSETVAGFVNNTVLVPEGGQVRLSPEMLPRAIQGRVSVGSTAYLVGTHPTRGEIALAGGTISTSSVSQFSHEDLSSGRVIYQHTGGEIGPDSVTDTCQLYIYNNGEWLTHSLNISILPVDNKGPMVSEGIHLLVPEGGRSVLTGNLIRATDPDTPAEDLQLSVSQPPRYGEIRLKQPHSGSETTVLEFTKRQLTDGHVFFVHTQHCGVEHTNDTFGIRASDGRRDSTSVPVRVVIYPVTDEPPCLFLSDFSIQKGETRILDTLILSVSDADKPEEDIKLKIVDLPEIGTLYRHWLSTETAEQVTLNANRDFTMSELAGNMSLVYKQDQDVTSLSDSFVIEARDPVYRVVRKCRISIITTNDLPPRLVEPTDRLQLRPGETVPVTERHLLIRDRDTPKDNLTLSLVQLPSRAQLLVASTLLSWSRHTRLNLTPLRLGEKITQRDVQLNRLFVHVPPLTGNLEEGNSGVSVEQAQFVPEDGKFSASLARLEIQVLPSSSSPHSPLQLITNPTELEVGSTVSIAETDVKVRVFGTQPPSASLQAIRPNGSCWKLCKKGEQNSSAVATELLASDIATGLIVFNASCCSEPVDILIQLNAAWDNQVASSSWFVRLLPLSPSVPPPRLLKSVPLSLAAHSAANIGPENLLMTTGRSAVTTRPEPHYRLISLPKHGILVRSRSVGLGPDDTFSQTDLNSSMVEYRSTNVSPSGRDSFLFVIDDPAVMRQATDRTHTFSIVVRSPSNSGDDSNVTILRAACPSELAGFSASGAGFRFDNRSILAVPQTAVFRVAAQPALGHLWLGDSPGAVGFAQTDINSGRLTYRFNNPRRSSDEIEDAFEIVASNGRDGRQVSDRKRVHLTWSVVGFEQRRYRIRCLSSGTLKLDVFRKGALNRPAFVRFETSPGSPDDRAHFSLISGSILNFNPGERAAQIKIHIAQRRNDTKRAKLRISLVSPGNCLVGRNSSTVVVLLNPNSRRRKRMDDGCGISSDRFEPSRSNDMALFRHYL
uniref:Frem_N domain-containing protein n=1 Tax=Macrostomum lignano TaxID=282301 RepID=A0A1I8GX65_9PLAT